MKILLKRTAAILAVLFVTAVGVSSAPAAAHSGPALQTPGTTLQQALSCTSGLSKATKTPILLVHGTFTTPSETWTWGYQRALSAKGHPVCTVTLPQRATIDMQTTVEYVVHAIREINDVSGREVSIIGHSQGGVLPTWALRFWPDLPDRVDDFVALAGPQNGTGFADALCAPSRCPDLMHQMVTGSKWMTALRRQSLDSSVSFTSIGSNSDEVVFPAPIATNFPGATNLLVQDVCPARVVGHIGMLSDAATFALVIDALTHTGPANETRVSRSVCLHSDYPGIDYAGRSSLLATGIAGLTAFATLPHTSHEPALRDYAVTG
ncbi:alpha/beta fold hydrolase [Nocardioides sp. NPDC000445]|uniref:esterase/lipase family protein n=1 Tax=Nocardioides sp. NPDC000445 TaxID=3154257 RepID=UPI003321DFCD